jgi:pimeloyl-ACP methyl ester carboxylesterase
MSCYVLVHGAWGGGWVWKRVRNRLQAAGHDVFTPTLTGLGARSHLLDRAVNLETHILDVVNLILWEDLSDIVLCGHSYGGCVITGVADRIPERIRTLVYLDAFIPDDNQSLMDLIPKEHAEKHLEAARTYGDGWKVPPIPAEEVKLNENDREWATRKRTMQPIETLRQRVHLTGALNSIKNMIYIRATGYEEGSPFMPFQEKARAAGWKVIEMTGGHVLMLDQPEQLATLLGDAT